MMKFGVFGALGIVHAIQTQEGHDTVDYPHKVEQVRAQLGNSFSHLIQDVERTMSQFHHLGHVQKDLVELRKAERLQMPQVEKEAKRVDKQANELMSRYNDLSVRDGQLRERKKELNTAIHTWNDEAMFWNKDYHHWLEFQHLTHKRIWRANNVNSLIRFVRKSLPSMYDQVQKLCLHMKEYIEYANYGTTNYQDPLEAQFVTTLKHSCQYDIEKYEVGYDEYRYCVMYGEGKKGQRRCQELKAKQGEFYKHQEQHGEKHHYS